MQAATYNWNVDIGAANSQSYTIGIIVNNYYTRNSSNDNSIITVSKPLGDFITGGGYLNLQSSAGIKAGDAGTKNNFGFNVKYNNSNKNLQGNINTIVRRMESNVLKVYQIKGNAMTSLSVNSTINSSHPYPTAVFNGKANITDITNPLLPVSVDGNATLQVTITDRGEPGSSDGIGITVWNKSGGLWFSSKWDGTKTTEQLLAGGNLVVRNGNALTTLSAINSKPVIENISSAINVEAFPNPSSNTFRIVVSTNNRKDKISLIITDVLGRIKEIKNNIIPGDRIEIGGSYLPGIYFAKIKQGENYKDIKLIKGGD